MGGLYYVTVFFFGFFALGNQGVLDISIGSRSSSSADLL
jgi:hypothetical protein